MYKILFLTMVLFLFTSCESKNSAFRYFDKDDTYAKTVQNTKKTDITKNNEADIVFRATYLNNIKKEPTNTFIVSVFFVNSKTQNIKENGYKLLLNEQEPLSIEKIDSTNEEYKKFTFKNSWANFYLVKFPLEKKVYNLNLKLSNENSTATLKFERW